MKIMSVFVWFVNTLESGSSWLIRIYYELIMNLMSFADVVDRRTIVNKCKGIGK